MRRKNRATEQAAVVARIGPIKTAVNLSVEAHKLLGIAVLDTGKERSQIVEDLILTHLKGYYLGRRAPGETGEHDEAA